MNEYRKEGQDVVLIGHSMGTLLAALLASQSSPHASLVAEHVKGVVALCPSNKSMGDGDIRWARFMLRLLPNWLFNLFRAWDRRGGLRSASITRFVGPDADESLRKLQARFNAQSQTPVFLHMVRGLLPRILSNGLWEDGLPSGETIWKGLDCPTLIVAGTADPITKPEEAIQISRYMGHRGQPDDPRTLEVSTSTADNSVQPSPKTNPSCPQVYLYLLPTSHALPYTPLARALSANIQHFLSSCVSPHLNPSWQLQHLTTDEKWDVKNYKKWVAVAPISEPIGFTFRAMKTLRQRDDTHSPAIFIERWKGQISAVVDISHDTPVYDPEELERGGFRYRKCPSVSKLPPTLDEVRTFVECIDELRGDMRDHEVYVGHTPDERTVNDNIPLPPLIAVHCHYGFNRTGFLVVSYLIERLGWPLDAAIEVFAQARPPGIRHAHFVDELWRRYWDWGDERGG